MNLPETIRHWEALRAEQLNIIIKTNLIDDCVLLLIINGVGCSLPEGAN
jgi:hypothetical protein